MKPTAPRRARKCWATNNPAYPEAHDKLYNSKMVCDCTWGRKHTYKVRLIRLDKASRDALVERVAKVIAGEWLKSMHYVSKWEQIPEMHKEFRAEAKAAVAALSR